MKKLLLLVVFSAGINLLMIDFISSDTIKKNPPHSQRHSVDNQPVSDFSKHLPLCPLTKAFDFPVGAPDFKGYYNAQPFGKNKHLGDDLNGKGGGNSDFGDPVYAISDGIVFFAEDLGGGWGKVVRIYHNYGTRLKPLYIESLYAHLSQFFVTPNTIVKRGQKIGAIGNVQGRYLAHLHLEIRNQVDMPIGAGYAKEQKGYLNPMKFIQSHRKIK